MKMIRYSLLLLLLCSAPACSSEAPERSVDPDMSIEPDTAVEPQIEEIVPKDSVDPEMVQPQDRE